MSDDRQLVQVGWLLSLFAQAGGRRRAGHSRVSERCSYPLAISEGSLLAPGIGAVNLAGGAGWWPGCG